MLKSRFLLITALLLVVLALAACGSDDETTSNPPNTQAANVAPATYTTLTVQQAHEQASADQNAILVDVREPSEWTTTGVPQGATLISLNSVTGVRSGEVAGLPKDQPIYVICNSGNRSRVAAEHLINLGYSTVYNIDGGIQDWLRADLPTEPYTP